MNIRQRTAAVLAVLLTLVCLWSMSMSLRLMNVKDDLAFFLGVALVLTPSILAPPAYHWLWKWATKSVTKPAASDESASTENHQ